MEMNLIAIRKHKRNYSQTIQVKRIPLDKNNELII